MPLVDVLIPTYRRKTGLAVTLSSLASQSFTDFDVVISDQTPPEESYFDSPEVRTPIEALRFRGHRVEVVRNLPRRGLAQQRQHLLDRAEARYVQYLDDDLLLEPGVLARMVDVLTTEGCGFVGCAAAGTRFLADVRPHEQEIELWDGPVGPEPVGPHTIPWARHLVNNAANPLHLESRLVTPDTPVVRYKVAWVGGNLLYDRRKLVDVGGFSFWDRLPAQHAGEEVVVQLMLLRYHGGCGLLPSGTYHLGLETTLPDREHNATALFGQLIAEYELRRSLRRMAEAAVSP